MHEMTIAEILLDQVFQVSRANRIQKIEQVDVEIGLMRQVVSEALQTAFAALSEGTPAQGATLRYVEKAIKAHCLQCDHLYSAGVDSLQCPRCGLAEFKIIEGNDIVLTSITGQQEQGETDRENTCG